MAQYAEFKKIENKMEYEIIVLPEGEVKLNFGRKVEICSAKSGMVLMGFPSLERAKYLLYSRKKGQYVYKMPKNEIVVKRAVRDYEKYLKEIRENITKAFMARNANSSIADTLAREILKEINLPYPYAV